MRRSGFKIMKRLIVLVKPLSGFMCLAVIQGVLGFLCAISITVIGSMTLLKAAGISGGIALGAGFACIVIFAVLRGILHYGEQACNHYIAFKLLAIIRDKVFKAMRRLAPAKLEGKDKGNLISIITSDIELLEVFYAHTISPICIAVLTCAIMLIFIGHYHIVLALIALTAYLCVGVAVPVIASHFNKSTGMQYRDRAGKLSGFVLESMRGLLESIRYDATDKRINEMDDKTDKLNAMQKKLKISEGNTSAVTDSVILLFSFSMLAASTLLYKNGSIGFDGLAICTVAMMSSFGPVAALSSLAGNLAHTLASGERVLAILDEEPVVSENTDGEKVEFKNLLCKNVGFAYSDEVILDSFNVDIPKNSIVSVTGPSGSGKSTALKLMMRFWDVDRGSIEMTGRNVKNIRTQSLRKNQSFVSQETQLFNDTIEANIKIADENATHEAVVEAAKKASIHDFIMTLPQGYETKVGELGDLLSDGEKQRLGLARAFLSNAPMILLDEPTSNLDSLNEGRILKSLDEYRRDKSIVLVSHRKSTSKIADKAYTVYRGRLS